MASLEVKSTSSPDETRPFADKGHAAVVMSDGSKAEIGPGDVAWIAPGHDAWTVGDEACVAVDFGGYSQYAKR